MRLVFAGTPEFAAAALDALLHAGHDVVLVLTQPDRPAGRGMAMQPSAVKQLAAARGLALHQPASLKSEEAQAPLRAAQPEAMIVAAYGLILPQAVLDLPRHGCLNIHASLLPRWRGAAPIQRALLAGDAETGVTIMQMDAGLDTGPMLLRTPLPIASDDTAGSLHDKLAALGAREIVRALGLLECSELKATPQPAQGVTYASKIAKAEAAIDWTRPAREIERGVRAFNPLPGATASLGGAPVKIWRAHAEDGGPAPPGEVLSADAEGIRVACGDGVLRVAELQKSGGKRLRVDDFLRGSALDRGMRFDATR